MKIRLIWDDCRPTIDRRPITYEDIENDIHLQEFESEDDLIKHLCDLSKCNEDDLEDCGEDNRAKIDCLLSSMNDRGDGTPNILFLSIDGDIIQDWLEEVDGLTCSEQDVKDEQMKYVEDRPWEYDEEFDFDDEYEDSETKLINKILKANNIKLKELDEYGSDGYWINDGIRNLKDLESIYKEYIKPLNNPQLEKEFIEVTHFDLDDEDEDHLDERLNSEDRTFEVNSGLTLNELDLLVIDEIANSYSTSSPVSGNWETETLSERNEIAETLKISYTDANDIMVKYLGFDQAEIDALPIYEDSDHDDDYDEYEVHLDEDLDVENTDHSDDSINNELLDMLNDINLEIEPAIGTSKAYEMYLQRLERFKNDKEALEYDLKDLMRTKVLPKDEVEDLINKYKYRISKLQESINESKLEKVPSELFEDVRLNWDTIKELKSDIYHAMKGYWQTVFSDEWLDESSFSLEQDHFDEKILILKFKIRKEAYFRTEPDFEKFKESLKTIPGLKLKKIHKKSVKVPYHDNDKFIQVDEITFQYIGQITESVTVNKDDTKLINEEGNQKPEWQIKKEKALEYYNKVKEWADDPKTKTACEYNIDVDRLNEWLGEDTDMIIKKENEVLTEDDNKDNTLKAAIDSAEKILDNPEVYSGSGDIERALDRALRVNRQQIRNGSKDFINVLFTGPAGTGKTARIKAWARKNKINLVKTIAGTMDETDLGGVPVASLADGVAVKLSTTQFDSLGSEPDSVLFLDEWNRAPRAVRATLLNLIQDHEIPDYREKTGMRFLPNFLFTVAAVNPSDDIGYNTDALDDAELGRVLEYEVAPDTKTWLDYTRAGLNSQLKRAEKNPNEAERAQDIKEIKGRLGIAEKLVTDPRFSFDSRYDIERSKEAKENNAGNGKILTYRNLTDVLDACDGTKDDFLDLWNRKCNSLKKPTVEEILKDYKDVEDKANDVLDSGTDSTVFVSKKAKLDKLRNQIKNKEI